MVVYKFLKKPWKWKFITLDKMMLMFWFSGQNSNWLLKKMVFIRGSSKVELIFSRAQVLRLQVRVCPYSLNAFFFLWKVIVCVLIISYKTVQDDIERIKMPLRWDCWIIYISHINIYNILNFDDNNKIKSRLIY